MTARAKTGVDDPAALAPSTAVSYLLALFDYLRLRQIDATELQRSLNVDLNDRDARVSELEAAELFNRAAVLAQDPDLGVHVAEHIRPGHYGVLGYVAMACTTLGEAMLAQQRYQGLVITVAPVDVRIDAEAIVLSWNRSTDLRYRQLAEFNLAGMLTFVRWITGQAISPLGVDFTYEAPQRLDEQRRVFACPIRFRQDSYRMIVPKSWQGLGLIQPDPAMRQLMDRLAQQQLLTLTRTDDPLVRARRLIAQRLGDGELELSHVASALHVSPRTFQRKLQEHGESFTQLVDGVRKEMAERYLEDASLSLTDIAFLLGYSAQSAFARAARGSGARERGSRDRRFRSLTSGGARRSDVAGIETKVLT